MWKRQLIGFEVIVDPMVDMFGPPDTRETFELRGKVRVVASKPLNLKGLLVSFHGTTQVNKEGKPHQVLSYMDLTLQDRNLIVSGAPAVLPAGVSDFPFEFTLPGDLPPSITAPFGNVQYKIAAILTSSRSFRATSHVDRIMTLRRHYLPSHSIIPHVPRTLLQCEREGKVRCEFSVPSVLWIQDDGGITVEGKVVPLVEEARVASVMVKLEQTEAFRTTSKNRYRPSFFVYNHDPRQFLVTPVTPTSYILPSTDLTLPLTAEIPLALHLDIRSPRVKSHVDSPLVDVEHIVRIRVSFIDSAQKPMWLDAPITITTVPAPSDPVLAVFARPNANPGEVLPGYDDLTYHPPPAVEASNPDQATLAGGLPEYSPREIVLSEPIVGTGATPGHLAIGEEGGDAGWRGERGGQVSLLEEGGILGEV